MWDLVIFENILMFRFYVIYWFAGDLIFHYVHVTSLFCFICVHIPLYSTDLWQIYNEIALNFYDDEH